MTTGTEESELFIITHIDVWSLAVNPPIGALKSHSKFNDLLRHSSC